MRGPNTIKLKLGEQDPGVGKESGRSWLCGCGGSLRIKGPKGAERMRLRLEERSKVDTKWIWVERNRRKDKVH